MPVVPFWVAGTQGDLCRRDADVDRLDVDPSVEPLRRTTSARLIVSPCSPALNGRAAATAKVPRHGRRSRCGRGVRIARGRRVPCDAAVSASPGRRQARANNRLVLARSVTSSDSVSHRIAEFGHPPLFVVQARFIDHLSVIRGQDADASAWFFELRRRADQRARMTQAPLRCRRGAGNEAMVVRGPTGEEELLLR